MDPYPPRSLDERPQVPELLHWPETALDALKKWDAGDVVAVVEMGGLGPSYEHAIQLTVFELIRDLHDKPLPESSIEGWGQETLARVNTKLGLSGAQVSAARSIVYQYLKYGYRKTLEEAKKLPDDRVVSDVKNFPTL